MRAAAAGYVDFREARPLDRRWNTKLRWRCEAYDADLGVRAAERDLSIVMAVAGADPKRAQAVLRYGNAQADLIERLSRPWRYVEALEARPTQSPKELFVSAGFGDPADPKVMAKYDAALRRLLAGK